MEQNVAPKLRPVTEPLASAELALKIRKHAVRMTNLGGSSHVGSVLSMKTADEPAPFPHADGCIYGLSSANERVRKTGCVVAEENWIPDGWAPPLVLGADSSLELRK